MNACISRSGARRSRREDFRIGGFEPFSTVDYPDCIAAVVFAQGCPLRCFYCHNPDLLPAAAPPRYRWKEIDELLIGRRGLLDAVVFSGGEPLAQGALIPAMVRVKDLGFKVGLHTSGVYPARFAEALALADWVGLDVKTGFDDYETVTGIKASGARVQASLKLLISSGVDYEVRTTVSSRAHARGSLLALARALKRVGVRRYVLQEERTDDRTPAGADRLADTGLHSDLEAMFESFVFRNA